MIHIYSLQFSGDRLLGGLFLGVHPFPANVFQNAPRNTPILTVTGYDNSTNNQLERLLLSQDMDSKYFILQRRDQQNWVLITNRTIDKPVNYTFHFRVFGYYSGLVQESNIIIDVTEKNRFPPTFELDRYEFVAYAKSFEEQNITYLGRIKAHDNDTNPQNNKFEYFIRDRSVQQIFRVLSDGTIQIIGPFSVGVSQYIFNVTAVDSGSPQKFGTTIVVVNVTHLKGKLFPN